MKTKRFFMYALGMLCVMLAVVCGGFIAMAVAVGVDGSGNDLNEGNPLEGADNDSTGKGIDAQGSAFTGSALEDAELADNRINDYVAKFRAHKFPMNSDAMKIAQQIKVDTKEPENYEIGEAVLDVITKAAFTCATTGDTAYPESIDLATYVGNNNTRKFSKGCTILVNGVAGYNEAGTAVDGSTLCLYCTTSTQSSVIVEPINGPATPSAGAGVRHVPSIPAGTKLQIMAPALSESEVEVAPNSAFPRPKTYYLQRKGCSIVKTELSERINKKAKWNTQDLLDHVLHTFRRKVTRTMLISAKSRTTTTNPKTGTEYAYTQEGILRQLRLGYQINGEWAISDLIGIAKMVFGKYATSNEIDMYVGPDAMEKIANIDFSDHPEIKLEQKLSEIGVGMSSFCTPFGTLNLKLEYALEDIGMSEYAIVTNMRDAKRLIYDGGSMRTIDHSKGEGGETRDAQSIYYIQDDCLIINAYNSMLVGPNVAAAGYSNIGTTVTSYSTNNALPASPSKGNVYYFTVDVTASNVTYPKGLWQYDGSAFVPYEGVIHG